ncbi:MAG TPA: biotin synthase BioB [Blastocatellia bacterium]|nr:biotin synthase BioB [Blastocatellia bacterium]HMY75729.1 biotin synthase BioB [Blastocatellia bacterium]
MHSHNGCAPLTELRFDWTYEEIETIYNLSLPELIFRAQSVHRRHHNPEEVQGCTLLSIKTGGCPEDCAYCPQSAHYQTGVARHALLGVEETLVAASKAKEQGASRFCMGAAWRDAPNGKDFDNVLAMVRGVRALGLEACCTLGMLNDAQAEALAEAGLTAYNHNLDTSPEFYGEIISTRTYEDRLATLARVRNSGVTVCSGGIIGLGETRADRYRLLEQLARQQPHPESVPINLLVKVEGTPLADQSNTDPLELVRMIATARILMPASMVRLSAGRLSLSDEAQALCFLAGANSIFMGEKLLTTPNPERDRDRMLLAKMGMRLQGSQLSASQAGC